MATFNSEDAATDETLNPVQTDSAAEGFEFEDNTNVLNAFTAPGSPRTLGKLAGMVIGLIDYIGTPSTRNGEERAGGAVTALSGTWTVTSGNSVISGAGGAALTELNVNEYILGPGSVARKIQAIGSDNQITVYQAWNASGAGITIYRVPTIAERLAAITASLAALLMPSGHIYALTLSNNGSDIVNDIDIAAGRAVDSTNVRYITLGSGLTKRLDAAWSVGTNQGGLDTGAIANTTYHVFVIVRSDTGVVDVLFSTSATSPTMPANYDYKRRIGAIMREGGAIVPFKQVGDEFQRTTLITSVTANNPGTSAVTRTLHVPIGISVLALTQHILENAAAAGSGYGYLSDLDTTDSVPSSTITDTHNAAAAAGNLTIGGARIGVRTNTSGQIRSRLSFSDANVTEKINVLGWIDTRNKDG